LALRLGEAEEALHHLALIAQGVGDVGQKQVELV
jgi:hypothetical protein